MHTLVRTMCCDCVLFLCLLPGVDPAQSAADFKAYLFTELCTRTPLNTEENGVVLEIANGQEVYAHDCLQRLRADELRRALLVLREMFAQRTPPPGSCAAWSAAAEGAGLVVGRVYTLHGGSGRGELGIAIERFSHGIFKCD